MGTPSASQPAGDDETDNSMDNGEAGPGPELDVVICTYNRADSLRAALDSLGAQTAPRDGSWRVLVVDNNSTDHTPQVVADFEAQGHLPGLRSVRECEQGLVVARQRAFKETTAPWVAFVDDDCTLAPDWITEAQRFLASGRPIAAFNGHNTLRFEARSDPGVHRPEWFAGFSEGDDVMQRDMLHGAGLVLSRSSIERSGWLDQPVVPDRRGNELISGGDNEMSLRARAGGGDLWFVPACRLEHHISADRMALGYVARLSYGLGQSKPVLTALAWEQPVRRLWLRLVRRVAVSVAWIGRSAAVLALRVPLRDPRYQRQIVRITYCIGEIAGVARLAMRPRRERRLLIGLATTRRLASARRE